jgi:exoribonuclease-2
MGAGDAPRNAHLRIKLGEVNEITLDIGGTVIERLDMPSATDGDENGDSGDDDESTAMPLTIAVDMSDSSAENADRDVVSVPVAP